MGGPWRTEKSICGGDGHGGRIDFGNPESGDTTMRNAGREERGLTAEHR
jgi:hypothetical protein